MALKRVGTPVVLTGVLLCTGLVGCTEENPSPAPLPTQSTESTQSSSPSDTATPSPSETPPVLPAAARGTSENAAKAFAGYYVDVVNFAMRTGETASLRALATAGCTTCIAISDRIQEVYDQGGRLEGRGWRVLNMSYLPLGRSDEALVSTGITITSQRAFEGPSGQPSESPASRGNLDFRLKAVESAWRVYRLDATQ